MAEGLDSLGIGPGARVALVADNSVEGSEAMFACAFLGAVAILVNTRYPVWAGFGGGFRGSSPGGGTVPAGGGHDR